MLLRELKAEARRAALARRAGCDPALGARLAAHVLEAAPPPAGAVVAGFWPMGPEIDIRPLLLALGRGHPIALPVTPKRGLPLGFRRWRPGEALARGPMGTATPAGEELRPDWLLVPLLAFDGPGGGWAMAAAITTGPWPCCRAPPPSAAPMPPRRWRRCRPDREDVRPPAWRPNEASQLGPRALSEMLSCSSVIGRPFRPRCAEGRAAGAAATLAGDLVVVNAENATHGFGLAPEMAGPCSPPAPM